MPPFDTTSLASVLAEVAPDGSDVRPLLRLAGGSMAHFSLAPGRVSRAVAHRTVEEFWYVVSGRGELWRKRGDDEATVELVAGTSLTIPKGVHFQFRASAEEGVSIIGVTLPPWPGDDEAQFVAGLWNPA